MIEGGLRARKLVRAAVGMLIAGALLAAPSASRAAGVPGTIAEFPLQGSARGPTYIAQADGALWFTHNYAESKGVAKLSPAGTVLAEVPIEGETEGWAIAAGPEGSVWYTTNYPAEIGELDSSGLLVKSTRLAAFQDSGTTAVAEGAEGDMWVGVETGTAQAIDRVSSEEVKEFVLPAGADAEGIALGPEKDLWYTDQSADRIGRITSTGTIKEFPVPTKEAFVRGITAGPEGDMWFTEQAANKIGRITPAGVVTEFPLHTPNGQPLDIAAGSDNNLWFTEVEAKKIGRITPAGAVTEFPLTSVESNPWGITAGPNGNVWFAEDSNDSCIGEILTGTGEELPAGTSASCAANSIPPHNTSAPVVSRLSPGVPGHPSTSSSDPTYSCAPGGWEPGAGESFSYEWLRNGTAVANGQVYGAQPSDAGQQLSCQVQATNAYGSAGATSTSVTVPSYWPPTVITEPVTGNGIDFGRTEGEHFPAGLGYGTLNGSVSAGTRPATCHFLLEAVGFSETKTVPCAQATATGEVSGAISGIIPYRQYLFRLVASDGTSTITGEPMPYLPGNLLNPKEFNPNGPYDLTLKCVPSTECLGAEIEEPGPPWIEFGEITITNFNAATGRFDVTVQVEHEQSFFPCNTGSGEGVIGAGLITLHERREYGGNQQCPTYTLSGVVDYGGEAASGHYQAKFAGNGTEVNEWKACYQTVAKPNVAEDECVPPAGPSKDACSGLSVGLGVVSLIPGVGEVTLALSIASLVTGAISLDPPDLDFTKVAKPPRLGHVTVTAGDGVGGAAAAAATRLTNSLLSMSSGGVAFLDALQRFKGAAAEVKTKPLRQQWKATIGYGRTLAAKVRQLVSVLRSVRHRLSDSALGRRHVSRSRLQRALTQARRHGLPQTLVAKLRRLGLEGALIEKAARELPSTVPRSITTPLGTILAPAFEKQLIAFAGDLEKYVAGLETDPLA